MAASDPEPSTSPEDAVKQPAPADEGKEPDSGDGETPAQAIQQHHVSKLLDEVLDEPEPPQGTRRFRHPMILDIALAVGLLVALGGFTTGLFKMYITHSAEQSIMHHNYKAAIAILQGAPLPGFFTIPGSDPDELLSQALYLDAMDKLEVDNDVDSALKELQQIKPGSRYFMLAQELIEENFEPSSTTLQGGAEHVETDPPAPVERKPLLPEAPQEGSQ